MSSVDLVVGGAAKSELLSKLRAASVELNAFALRLFDDPRFTTSSTPTAVRVRLVSVAVLGFPTGADFASLVERARASGLDLCSLELGPHLRLALPEQAEVADAPATRGCAPPGSITVASAPLDDRDETPKGFYLRRVAGTLWLRGYRSWGGHVWSPHDVLAFAETPGAQAVGRQPDPVCLVRGSA